VVKLTRNTKWISFVGARGKSGREKNAHSARGDGAHRRQSGVSFSFDVLDSNNEEPWGAFQYV